MPNEFIIKNGFISKGDSIVEGSITAVTISATTYQNLPDNVAGKYLPLSGGTVSGSTIFTQNISVTGGTGINWFSGNTSTDLLRITQTGTGNAFVVEDETNPDSTSFVINSGGSVSIGTTRVFSVGGAETKLNISNGTSGLATTGLTVSTPLIVESSVTSSIGMLSPDNQLSQIYFGTPSDTFGAVLRWDYTNKNFNLGTSTTAGKLIFLTGTYDEAARINQSGNFGIGTSSPRAKLEVSGNTIITGDLVVSGITGTTWFSGNSSSDLVRVTQTGSGNALVVQDLSNPDGTPFVITNDGSVGIGEPVPDARLSIVPSTIPSSNTNIGIKVEVGGSGSTGTVLNVSGSGTTTGLSITSTSSNSTANGIIVNSGVNVFNEVGDATSDFRIEGDTDPNLFFVDASADDIGIGTNSPTRKLTVSGDYTFIHNPVTGLTSSVSGYGDVVTFGTGSLTAGNLYYFTSGGAWSNADADSTALSTGLLGIALGTTATTSGVLIRGYVRSASYTASTGSKLYVSPTAGSITSTAPSVAGQILRIIGYQLNSTNNVVYFNPSNDWIEL